MDSRIIIKPNSIKYLSGVKDIGIVTYGFDENDIPYLIELLNIEGNIVSKENFSNDYSLETVSLIEEEILYKNNEIMEKLKIDNIFFFEEPVDENKFIGYSVLFDNGVHQIQTKIIGYDKELDQFQLENFFSMVHINDLFYDGAPLSLLNI